MPIAVRRRPRGRVLLLLIATAAWLTACSSGSSSPDITNQAPLSRVAPTSAGTVVTTVVNSRSRIEGFREVTITVRTPDGQTRQWCLMLADTEPLRQQGLMFVTDPALGGYDGMLFSFEEDSSGGFWMKNTRLPLSIAYLRDDGSVLKTLDMEPCPDDEPRCPTYPAGGSYRSAIEVPKGGLPRLGITADATVTIGEPSCPPA